MRPLSSLLSTPARSSGRVAAVLLVIALAACDGLGPVGPEDRLVGAVGGGADTGDNVNDALIGNWRRTFVFVDEFGFAHAIETTWQFAGDGTAVRTIVTSNLTLQVSDVIVTVARWRVQGGSIVLEFQSPDTGQVILDFVIVGNELTLAGEIYSRVGG